MLYFKNHLGSGSYFVTQAAFDLMSLVSASSGAEDKDIYHADRFQLFLMHKYLKCGVVVLSPNLSLWRTEAG